MIGIYKITNPMGNVYIGQSVNIDYRWKRYQKYIEEIKSQTKIYNSIKKYGIDKHKFELIEECSIDLLNDRERYYQIEYDSVKNGLNCKYTTTKSKTGHLSEETKNKISEANKGRVFTNEWKQKISESLTGRTIPNEVTEKRLRSRKGYTHNNVTINKIKESNMQFKNITCPHCGKSGKQGMYRWHFDNCRLR